MTPDPIGLAGGINLYAYVLNDPVNWIDPKGLTGIAIETGGGAGTPFTGSDTAGSGLYIGAKKGGYAELGAFTSEQGGKIRGVGKAGVGIDFTAYFVDAEEFFAGISYYKTWILGPASYTKIFDACGNQIGVQVGIWGVGGGLGIEKGVSEGQQFPLQ